MNGKFTEKDDDDSVIYMSDNSVASISEIENWNHSIECIVLDNSSNELDKDTDVDIINDSLVLQQEKFIVREAVEEVIKQHYDKATQTYDNEFPTKVFNETVMSASTLGVNKIKNISVSSEAVTFGLHQSNQATLSTVPVGISVPAIISTSTRVNDQNYSSNENLNSINSTTKEIAICNNVSQTTRTYKHKKTYKNYRIKPYRHCNNNYKDNYNRSNHTSYDNNYENNGYYNRNYHDYYNNQPNIARYNYNYYYNHNNLESYGNQYFMQCQFKDRLFSGFANLMDYVFNYDYSQDVNY